MQVRERIRPLDAATIGEIAAGEIIERPASVVKELVENSIDAGATLITVELQAGGCGRISVRDDGAGIPADQLALALQRHCTSKLHHPGELFAIASLGFRGEGLASIAAAAGRLEIISRPADQTMGARISAAGQALEDEIASVPSPPGTTVQVEELFAHTPVRRQFLKSDKVELARVSAFLSQLALGWPQISFVLRHEGRQVWNLPAVEAVADRIEMALGKESRGALLALSYEIDAHTSVRGFSSKPGHDRPNRQGQIIFVNGRLVRSPQITAAWSAAYSAMLSGGRYPFGALLIELPPDEVDVNVHPAKLEVRLLNGNGVFEAVRRCVQTALRSSAPERSGQDSRLQLESFVLLANRGAPTLPAAAAPDLSLLNADAAEPGRGIPTERRARALGQIDDTYILIGDGEMLLILDQHAAHERVAYEALLESDSRDTTAEPLLFPTLVELSMQHAATLEACRDELTAVGIEIENFGDTTYRIVSLPAIFARRPLDLVGMLSELAQPEGSPAPQERRRRLLATIACHSVVRAHERLSLQEQIALYDSLRQ
ncbi:MAG: DNA mismatch repair endonuclease MutL, partial [Candidatus Eremiobacteraeota bacterium]|nr:DNA mismatch repair endonuclease MutL [Candidatus Eremiobacteraeota bacterium]